MLEMSKYDEHQAMLEMPKYDEQHVKIWRRPAPTKHCEQL